MERIQAPHVAAGASPPWLRHDHGRTPSHSQDPQTSNLDGESEKMGRTTAIHQAASKLGSPPRVEIPTPSSARPGDGGASGRASESTGRG